MLIHKYYINLNKQRLITSWWVMSDECENFTHGHYLLYISNAPENASQIITCSHEAWSKFYQALQLILPKVVMSIFFILIKICIFQYNSSLSSFHRWSRICLRFSRAWYHPSITCLSFFFSNGIVCFYLWV